MSGLDSDDGGQQLLLGKMLLERGLINADQLREALVERAKKVAEGDKSATPLGGILIRKGFLTEVQLSALAAEQGKGETTVRRELAEQQIQISGPQLPALPGQDNVQAGTQLGKYLLTKELGRGGMGVVFEATDTQLQRKVALKLMLSNPNADPKARAIEEERFIQEAQLSARLKHPNIVTVYEAGLLEGRQFLAMELIEGMAFNEWRRTVSVKEQIRVIRDVASAVHHAHEQGILHRDLKPRNILMGGTRPYVTDFGLAKSLSKSVNHSLTGSGAVVGTPAYMSPEQAQGLERVDWRTDIYSIGIILYETLTGRTPFTGESPIEILMKVVKDPVPPPLSVAASTMGLDKAIESICLKAVAKKDKDRYPTAQAFADDLTKWLGGEQVKVSVPKGPRSPMRRIYALVGVLVLSLGATLGFLAWTASRKPSVEADLAKGREYLAAKQFEEAKAYFWLVLAKDAGNPEALEGERLAKEGMEAREKEKAAQLEERLKETLKEVDRIRKDAEEKRRLELEAATEEERSRRQREREHAEREAKRLEDDARNTARVIERSRPTIAPGVPGSDADQWRSAVDLYPYIDVARNSVWGSWDKREALVSDRRARSRVEIPYQPSAEYDLRVQFERRTGAGGVSLILPSGVQAVRCEFGGAGNTRSCIEFVQDFREIRHEAVVEAPLVLENDRKYIVVAQVRKSGVTVQVDGRPYLEWKGDFSKAGLSPEWKLRNAQRIGLGSDESETAFHHVELREVEGKGRPAGSAMLPALRAIPVPGALKPGLIAEYYHGSSFDVLALRKTEAALDFSWSESPAWPGGPVDHFSCRFSGYLHVPRTAQYSFALKADDGARLVIDDVQLIGAWTSRTDIAHTAEVSLEEGFHRILVEHFEGTFRAGLELAWSPGGGSSMTPLAHKAILHNPADFKAYAAPPSALARGSVGAHTNSVTALQYMPVSGQLVSSSEDRRVRFWKPGALLMDGNSANHPAGVLCTAVSPDGKWFATGARDQRLRIWDFENRSEIRTLEGFEAFVQCAAFSPDGKLLAAGSFDRTVRVYETGTWELRHALVGHAGGIEALAFTPDGTRLVTGSLDRTLRTWDLSSGKETGILRGHADSVSSLALSSDGQTLYSGASDGLIKAWDLASKSEIRVVGRCPDEILSLALSGDGRVLAAGGNGGMIRVWDLLDPKDPRVLHGHVSRVTALVFQPGRRLLASGSFDGTVRLWSME